MSTNQLPNYLKSCRKTIGFSQQELAFLLECDSGKTVSRYERFARQPDLRRVLAYEIVSGRTVRELFGGVYLEVEKITLGNAQVLLEKLRTAPRNPATKRKIAALELLLENRLDVPHTGL